MVLSRFWLAIFISSILFVVFSLFVGNSYTIDYVLNGKIALGAFDLLLHGGELVQGEAVAQQMRHGFADHANLIRAIIHADGFHAFQGVE